MEWIPVEVCPVCGSKGVQRYGQGSMPTLTVPEILGGVTLAVITNYVQCIQCGLIRQSPRLDDVSIMELYSSGQYRQMLNIAPDRIDTDEEVRK